MYRNMIKNTIEKSKTTKKNNSLRVYVEMIFATYGQQIDLLCNYVHNYLTHKTYSRTGTRE